MLGLATGLSPLDEATGGLQGFMLAAGETGVGKSSLVLNLGIGVLRQNPKAGVLLYTLELPKDTYLTTLLANPHLAS
jgi:replicative DNA helicase